jgi:hypothetical protein
MLGEGNVMIGIADNARLNYSLIARIGIELNLINDGADPNSVESHALNIIEARCQRSPGSAA